MLLLMAGCAAYDDRLIVHRTKGKVWIEGSRVGRLVTEQKLDLPFTDCRVFDVGGEEGGSGSEVWRVTTIEPGAALAKIDYGKTPAGYAQVTPPPVPRRRSTRAPSIASNVLAGAGSRTPSPFPNADHLASAARFVAYENLNERADARRPRHAEVAHDPRRRRGGTAESASQVEARRKAPSPPTPGGSPGRRSLRGRRRRKRR